MKNILLVTISAAALAVSADCHAMWRARTAPTKPAAAAPKVRVPVSCEKIAQIKKLYPLLNSVTGAKKISQMTGPELATHLRYDQLCYKASIRIGEHERAKDHLKSAVKKCAGIFLAPTATALLLANSADELSIGLFTSACGYSLYAGSKALEDIHQAVREYKQAQVKKQTVADELATMVAEQKFQFKVPNDIQ